MRKKLIALSLFVITGLDVNSQTTFNICTGLSIPTGEFKKGNLGEDYIADHKYGTAGTGVHLGFNLIREISNSGLCVFAGLDINRHAIRKSKRTKYEESFENNFFNSSTYDAAIEKVKHATYINVPLSAGLRYHHTSKDEKLSYYGSIGLTYNTLKMTDFDIQFVYGKDGNLDETDRFGESYHRSSNLGLTVEGGIILKNKYTIGVTVMRLGAHAIDYASISYFEQNGVTQTNTKDYTVTKNISFINLSFGLLLGGKKD